MKKFSYLILFLLVSSLIFPRLIGTLPQVMKPTMIVVKNNKLYIAEGAIFSVYSINDQKLLHKFGKKGEGPGELIEIPHVPNKISIVKGKIFVTGIGKAISFSKTGEFISEFKTTQSVFQLIPAGNNFIAKEFAQSKDGKVRYMTITLYNSNMKKLKELYRQPFVQQQGSPGIVLDMTMEFVSIVITEEKIFLEESPKGFLIEVFDLNGNKLYDIEKKYTKTPVTSKDREKLENKLKNDPQVKQQANRVGGWGELKKFIKMNFSAYFPPIKGIEASGNRLYVRTYNMKDGKDEYIVMDLKGNVMKKVFISSSFEPSINSQIAGGRLSSIENGKLYYLLENEDDEEWELHVEKL